MNEWTQDFWGRVRARDDGSGKWPMPDPMAGRDDAFYGPDGSSPYDDGEPPAESPVRSPDQPLAPTGGATA